MNLDFKLKGGPYGDATSSYEIIFPEGLTVGEFVKYIVGTYSVEHNEWGDISLDDGYKLIEYNRGKIVGSVAPHFEKYIKSKIVRVTANGGWSLMSYRLFIERGDET